MAGERETDPVTGTETTGHEWDGIKELNTPLPRWWLWLFYATIIWAIGYWIAMPAWPLVSDYTKGVLNHSNRANVAARIAAVEESQSAIRSRVDGAELAEIRTDPELLDFAMAGGRSAFAVNCSQCHGLGAAGSIGYPNLNDDNWLWGGDLEAIAQTIRYGIRAEHDETRFGDMPAFVDDEVLTEDQVAELVQYVLGLSGQDHDATAAESATELWVDNCGICHGEDGSGGRDFGAPNLTNAIWLYGGDADTIRQTIAHGRRGMMPAWTGRLDEVTLKLLAVYVHALGGGE